MVPGKVDPAFTSATSMTGTERWRRSISQGESDRSSAAARLLQVQRFVISVGDLMDRSDLHGGRTGWGDVPLQVRNQIIPGAALYRTMDQESLGQARALTASVAYGFPYPVTTADEALTAMDDYLKTKPEFVKIWVDDRWAKIAAGNHQNREEAHLSTAFR